MNSSIRKVALALGLVFAGLFANLNLVQIARSTDMANHPFNDRNFLERIGRRRGEIIAADGTIVGVSVPFSDPRYQFRRTYPLKNLFGHITGFYAPRKLCLGTGLEDSYEAALIGDEPPVLQDWVDDLLGRERTGNVIRITIEPKAQRAARRALGGQHGSVAAIDPRTGAVLALYSNPSYNPNRITREHPERCEQIRRELNNDPDKPLLFRATQERYPPGSTMKIITAAAALEDGATPDTTVRTLTRLDLPDSDRTLGNFGNGTCGGSMRDALKASCNTAFAQFGLRVGAAKFAAMARKFGFDRPVDLEVPATRSCVVAIPGGACDEASTIARPFVALSSIGQYSVRATALQMARIAATVSNGGHLVDPYLVSRIEDAEGATLLETPPSIAKNRIYSRRTARAMRSMMIDVVRSGTGSVVGFDEVGVIGGKTGTAETGVKGEAPHVWFVAFAPDVAVAVVVENGGDLRSAATGGRVAGPIAKAVLETLRGRDKNQERP